MDLLAKINSQILRLIKEENLPLIYALIIFAIYGLLFSHYAVDNIDDAWTISLVYNYLEHNYLFDRLFGASDNGTIAFFGKLHAQLYGNVLSLFGWNRYYAHVISYLFIFLAALLWYSILFKRFALDKTSSSSAVFLMLLFEPVIAAANTGRTDAMCLFLLSLVAYLALLHRAYFFGALVASLAVETHPMGLTSPIMLIICFALNVLVYKETFTFNTVFKILSGGALGILFYLFLHYDHLERLPYILSSQNNSTTSIGGLFYAYYFKTKFLRHVPELVLTIIALLLFFTKKNECSKNDVAGFYFVLANLGVLFIVGRQNHHYMSYAIPFLCLLYVLVGNLYKSTLLVVILFIGLLLPQYSYLIYRYASYDTYTEEVIDIAANLCKNKRIIGHPNYWFDFVEDERFRVYQNPELEGQKEFCLIENVWLPTELTYNSDIYKNKDEVTNKIRISLHARD